MRTRMCFCFTAGGSVLENTPTWVEDRRLSQRVRPHYDWGMRAGREVVVWTGLVAIACLTGACAATTHRAPPPPPPPRPVATLTEAIRAALEPLYASGTAVAFLVRDPAHDKVLASDRPDMLVTPASTLKLLTTAAALRYLGPDRRFVTRVLAGRPDRRGVVHGDLWLLGDGDPSFGSGRAETEGPFDRPSASPVLVRLARELKNRGIRAIRGDVVGDGRALSAAQLGRGWSWDDAAYAYSALPSGLTYLEGLVQIEVQATADGITTIAKPRTGLVQVDARVVPDQKSDLVLAPGECSGCVVATVGKMPERGHARTFVAVPDPPLYAAEQLAAALRAEGIKISGDARAVTEDDEPAPTKDAPVVIAVSSPPLRELAEWTNTESLNLYAEVLLRQLGRLAYGDPSAAGGVRGIEAFLGEANVDPARVRIVDGSGLSRMNLLSCRALVAVLETAVRNDPNFADLLAVAGRTGTMRKRLAGTSAQGRVRAKTGTLTGHRNIVGLIETVEGRTLSFAFVLSGVVVSGEVADGAVDRVLVGLVNATSGP